MGLNISHDCWDGSCSNFNRWRRKISEVAGFGDMMEYEGFSQIHNTNKYMRVIGIRVWPDEPLAWLLSHSDCDGSIPWIDCASIADDLETLLPSLNRSDTTDFRGGIFSDREIADRFITGLRLAHSLKEDVEFR